MKKLKLGKYHHYKSPENIYEILGVVIYTETLEEMVLYKQLHNNNPKFPPGTLYVRPKKMFLEKVVVNGHKISRFKFIKEN